MRPCRAADCGTTVRSAPDRIERKAGLYGRQGEMQGGKDWSKIQTPSLL